MEREVAQIRLRARRRVGELSAALDEAKNQHALPEHGKSKREALDDAGLSTSEAHRCEQIAKVPLAVFETYIATKAAGRRALLSPWGRGVGASRVSTASQAWMYVGAQTKLLPTVTTIQHDSNRPLIH